MKEQPNKNMKETLNEEKEKMFSNIMGKGINDLIANLPVEEKTQDLTKELEFNQKYEEKTEIIEEIKQKDAYNPAETNAYEANNDPKSQYQATEEFNPIQNYNNNTYF